MDNGARRALIPLENKRNFLEVTGDIMEHVDPIFFGDPKTAAFKALGLNCFLLCAAKQNIAAKIRHSVSR